LLKSFRLAEREAVQTKATEGRGKRGEEKKDRNQKRRMK